MPCSHVVCAATSPFLNVYYGPNLPRHQSSEEGANKFVSTSNVWEGTDLLPIPISTPPMQDDVVLTKQIELQIFMNVACLVGPPYIFRIL